MKTKTLERLMVATVVVGLTASAAARTMTVTPHKTANVVDSVALAFGDDDAKTYALYVAYGSADAGSDISRWEKSEKVADIAVGATAYNYSQMPYGWGSRYHAMRFFLFDPGAAKPFDKQLEYLKGDGNTYVKTGYTPTGLAALEVDFKGTGTDGTSIFCARSGSDPFDLFMESTMLRFDYFGYTPGGVSLARVRNDGARHRVRCDRNGISVDGLLSSKLSCNLQTKAAGSEVVLLGLHSSLSVSSCSKHTIYGFKAWSNATDTASLVLDLVPCVKDEVVCFYDRVSGTFLANSGTGALVAGPEGAYLGKTAAVTSAAIADFAALKVTAALTASGATVSFPALPAACRLVMAYGAQDGGVNLADWENRQIVATLAAGATSQDVAAMPAGWGDRYHFVRFFLTDESNCPFDKQVAYIQGQGAQYIETDYTPTGCGSVEADFELTTYDNQAICCSSTSGYTLPYLLMFFGDGTARWDYLKYDPTWVKKVTLSLARHQLRADVNRLYYDGEEILTLATTNGAAAGSQMVLFAKHSGLAGGWNSYGKYKLYSFKAWSNHKLLDTSYYSIVPTLDLIPCVKGGVAGLFNRVNGTFFGGKGTGSFLTGADVPYVDAARLGVTDPLYAAAGRTIVAKRSFTAGLVSRIDLTFGAAQSDYKLYAAFAATDCGANFDDWTLKQTVTTIAADDTSYAFTDFPTGWGTDYKFVRFFLLGDKMETCPYESRVAYLTANIKQSILTDFYPTGKSAMAFEYDNQDYGQRAAFCARDAGGGNSYSLWIGGRYRFDYYNFGVRYNPAEDKNDPNNLGRHQVRCDASGVWRDDELVISNKYDTVSTATGYPMTIFSRHNALASETPDANFSLYWFKAWQNSATDATPTLDLVPCVKNKEGCLYDRVGCRFFFNRTMTPFAVGAVVSEDLTSASVSAAVGSDPSGLAIIVR